MTVTTRLLTVGDAAEMAERLRANREFLAPWEPDRSEEYFTEGGQRRVLTELLRQHEAGSSVPHAIVDDGRLVGRIAITNIARGPFLSGSLGYWVSRDANGRGVATAAVGRVVRLAFDELGLHRVEAGTLVDNTGSQRVLQKNGFRRFGLAPRYLWVAGAWRDHILFQRLADD
ncbi:GNAT family N-acetyltransferase [Actinoplanes sp. M2I2]|uniref:GNAT family N-acetyltransferase n=1 Tax=Actinoplanes sp. M2I2 TaxID=1734444 RepID=UPI0020207655|nr:GNAT family protein [Actinoplanes sp. M2I2]